LGLPPDLATTIDEILAAGQQELADESTAGSRETVSGAGHEIQVDRPAAVIDALESILDDLTAYGAPVQPAERRSRRYLRHAGQRDGRGREARRSPARRLHAGRRGGGQVPAVGLPAGQP
jgi:hypothetical protein